MLFVFNLTAVVSVLLLVFLEGALSLDNALVLALMVRHLPEKQKKRALSYGIWGAFLFRFVSLFFLSQFMGNPLIKLAGGSYLVFLALKNLFVKDSGDVKVSRGFFPFWTTVALVEVMDASLSADSILAAVSLSQNYFIIMAGAILGIVMMRFAANGFGRLIDNFPGLQKTAFFLVFLIGAKLIIESGEFSGIDFHDSRNPAGWIFWASMASALAFGFRRPGRTIAN